jgi:hypothetical protein
MFTTTFTAIAPFEMVLFSEHNKAVFRKIIILFLQLVAFGKTLKFFTHGDAKIS